MPPPGRDLACDHVPLAIDISRPIRSRVDQQELVRAVFDAPANEQETHYLEWKGPLALAGKDAAGRATIAKAVLGFANRDPTLAARAMAGCAYLLAGVSPGDLPGVEAVDVAQLEAQVVSYVGRNIDWRADYVVVDERTILVVTVEPPCWGDPVHPVRKTFNPSDRRGPVLQEGTVFVRHQASTNPATAADLDMLSRRAARGPGDELEVQVRAAAETVLRGVEVGAETIEQYVKQQQSYLLAPVASSGRKPGPLSPYGQNVLSGIAGLSVLNHEYRSEEKFREEVNGYVDKLRNELPNVLRARAVLHGIARLKLEIVNNTDTTFTKVRVEAKLPPALWVTGWREDVRDEAEPPEPPIPYGQARMSHMSGYRGLSARGLRSIRPGALGGPWRPEIERRTDAVYVDYVPEDVRAQGVTPLPSLWLLLDDLSTKAVEVRWEATATNAAKRVTGTFTVPVNQRSAGLEELLAELPDDT